MPWLTEAVVPVPPPKQVSLVNGLVDVAFWQIIVYAVFVAVRKVWIHD